jgi:hypothetical protein
MNKSIKYFSVLIACLLLTNCNSKKQKLTLNSAFKKIRLASEEVHIDNAFFANPNNIEIIDTIMLFVDEYKGKCLTAID